VSDASDPNRMTRALITGANKGIGFEIAKALRLQGIDVIIGARDRTRGTEAARALDAEFVQLDITDDESVAHAAAEVETGGATLDILVNNAGILLELDYRDPTAVPIELVQRTYDTNVFGAIRVTNAFLPLLRRAPAARIVNVSSRLASLSRTLEGTPSHLLFLAHNSSKTALNAVTLQYALALRDTPIKINAADPGHSATDINGHMGDRPPSEAARLPVRLALLPDDGPTGAFISNDGEVPW
jgi:NAD(P)-dependent dehydrogenase (short-subunit alcohol dehydrogenase family)